MANPTYADSRYAFTSPTRERKYIGYLAQIAKCNANGFEPTRKQVQVALGDPDPTKPSEWNIKYVADEIARCRKQHKRIPLWAKERQPSSNWGISRWTAMKQAGLIRSERVGNTVRYQITADGLMLLHSVM